MKKSYWLISVMFAVVIGCEEYDDPIEEMSLSQEEQELELESESGKKLVAEFELDNGFSVSYYTFDDGSMSYFAVASNDNEDQVASFMEYHEALKRGLSTVELYERYSQQEAPAELIEAQERVSAAIDEQSDELDDVEVLEGAQDDSFLASEAESRGPSEPMTFDFFEHNYCGSWLGPIYEITSTRCEGYQEYHTHTSTSRKRQTWATVRTLNSIGVWIKHQGRLLGWEWDWSYGGANFCYFDYCPGDSLCASGSWYGGGSDYNYYRRRVGINYEPITPGAEFHLWTALAG